MNPVMRKVAYRMYPSRRQAAKLLEMLSLHQQLYNTALEQRISVWQTHRKSVTYNQQCRDLTELRRAFPEYDALSCSASQITLRRLDRAFRAFFQRNGTEQQIGFPRFKSLHRFSGWGYAQNGVGFKFDPEAQEQHGRLHLSGVGHIPLRGRARTLGQVRNCDIQRKNDRWYAVFTFACQPKRERGNHTLGIDLSVDPVATVTHEGQIIAPIPEPEFLLAARARIALLTYETARKKHGSRNCAKAARRMMNYREKVANRLADFLHKASTIIVNEAQILSIDDSVRETLSKTGSRQAFSLVIVGTFSAMLRYKAVEAGSVLVETSSRGEAVKCVTEPVPPGGNRPSVLHALACRLREALPCVSSHNEPFITQVFSFPLAQRS